MPITFDNIAGGELAEKFSMALAQIGRNILDPNMDQVSYDIKTKLAGLAKSETVFLIGQDARTGRIEMSEYGNNRPAVSRAYDAVPAAPGAQPEETDKPFDPDTGEILETGQRGPIDLRTKK